MFIASGAGRAPPGSRRLKPSIWLGATGAASANGFATSSVMPPLQSADPGRRRDTVGLRLYRARRHGPQKPPRPSVALRRLFATGASAVLAVDAVVSLDAVPARAAAASNVAVRV